MASGEIEAQVQLATAVSAGSNRKSNVGVDDSDSFNKVLLQTVCRRWRSAAGRAFNWGGGGSLRN